jgi:hypothetical protein
MGWYKNYFCFVDKFDANINRYRTIIKMGKPKKSKKLEISQMDMLFRNFKCRCGVQGSDKREILGC